MMVARWNRRRWCDRLRGWVGVVGCNRSQWLGGLRGGLGVIRSNHWHPRDGLRGGGGHRRLKSEVRTLESTRSGGLPL
jgi:hypothetical protein